MDTNQMMEAFQALLLQTQERQKAERKWKAEEAEKLQEEKQQKAGKQQRDECKQEAEEWEKEFLFKSEKRQKEECKHEPEEIKSLTQEQSCKSILLQNWVYCEVSRINKFLLYQST